MAIRTEPITELQVEAALCVWEAMLESDNPDIADYIEQNGSVVARNSCLDTGTFASAVWHALDEDTREAVIPFDWEFVPKYILPLIEWNLYAHPSQSVEAAVVTIRRLVLGNTYTWTYRVATTKPGDKPFVDMPFIGRGKDIESGRADALRRLGDTEQHRPQVYAFIRDTEPSVNND